MECHKQRSVFSFKAYGSAKAVDGFCFGIVSIYLRHYAIPCIVHSTVFEWATMLCVDISECAAFRSWNNIKSSKSCANCSV